MNKQRRAPTTEQEASPGYRLVEQRCLLFEKQLSKVLMDESKQHGGLVQLEGAIAAVTGGFPVLERRKLASLIEAPQRKAEDRPPATLTLKEIAALDVFWRESGGFAGALRAPSLAESISKMDRLIAFLPSLPWPEKSDPEKLGFVPVADVRAAATLRQIVLGLNPRLPFQIEEVPSGDEQDAQFGRLFGGKNHSIDALLDNVPQARGVAVTLISIGSDRSNLLSKFLLHQFFPEGWPFTFRKEGTERQLLVRDKQYADHAVICVRRAGHRRTHDQRLEIVIAGDRSLSTLGAAAEIGTLSDSVELGQVMWALVEVIIDHERSKVTSSRILPGYPIVHTTGS